MEEAVKLRRYLASLVVYSKVLSVSDGRDNWQLTSVQVFVEQANNPVLYDIENHWLLKYTTGLTARAWENCSKVLTQNRIGCPVTIPHPNFTFQRLIRVV